MLRVKEIFSIVLSISVSIVFFSCARPGDSTVQNGVTAYGAGKYDDALELFMQALDSDTRYSKELIYNFISNVYAAQEDFENSSIWLEKSLESKPDYRGYVTLGMNYQSLKKIEEAEKNYLKAISLDESKGEGWASLGILYLENGFYEKAVENLIKGCELSPKIAVIHAYLGVALHKMNRVEDGAAEFAIAEEMKCSNLDSIRDKFEIR